MTADRVWVAPNATVVGEVVLHDQVSIWYGAVLRADGATIEVGAQSNVQDGVVVHTDPGFSVTIGRRVSVGHNAVLHGCQVEDDALVGMGAIVMNGARIGSESLVAAGALVAAGMDVPARSLVAGVPARVRRELTDDEVVANRKNAQDYLALAAKHSSF